MMMRLPQETKTRLEEAARRRGLSLTSFVVHAAEEVAGRSETKKRTLEKNQSSSRDHFRGVPTFFRAACFEASKGGEHGYKAAGWTLGLHVAQLTEGEPDDVNEKLNTLEELLEGPDDEAVFDWFQREFPKCASLVPVRRRFSFVEGIRNVYAERGLD